MLSLNMTIKRIPLLTLSAVLLVSTAHMLRRRLESRYRKTCRHLLKILDVRCTAASQLTDYAVKAANRWRLRRHRPR